MTSRSSWSTTGRATGRSVSANASPRSFTSATSGSRTRGSRPPRTSGCSPRERPSCSGSTTTTSPTRGCSQAHIDVARGPSGRERRGARVHHLGPRARGHPDDGVRDRDRPAALLVPGAWRTASVSTTPTSGADVPPASGGSWPSTGRSTRTSPTMRTWSSASGSPGRA